MSCAPVQSQCLPPQGYMALFKGTKGDAGPEGPASTVPGPAGPMGAYGAVGVYTGTFSVSAFYYDIPGIRKDIVDYAGQFWIVNNPAKSGLDTWDAPTASDWLPFGTSLINVATDLRLLVPVDIAVGMNLIPPAYFKSNNFVENTIGEGVGWILIASGYVELNGPNNKFNGQITTDSPRFNFESITRTMPAIGYAEFAIAAIANGAIPVNPTINNVTDNALIFFGWTQGANNYIENRFGNTAQKFNIVLEGIGTNTSAGTDQFYIQVYYRLRDNGGAWGAWVKIGQDWYMQKLATLSQSFNLFKTLSIALTGTQDIQFSAGFSKGASGIASVGGAMISVEALN